MRKFALIGYPIAHSGSPELFRLAYGGRMRYDLVGEKSFEKAWGRFIRSYDGINVTAPFKEDAFKAAACCDPACGEIGAANILKKTDKGVAAFNSDHTAVRECLKGRSGRVLIAGWGGAGRAAWYAAEEMGLEAIVCNRTARAGHIRPLDELPQLAAESDILIYTLPVAVPQLEALPKMPVILEANYAAPCLRDKAQHYISGREWLIQQAVAGFPLLTGETPQLRKDIISLTGFMGCGKSSVGKAISEKTGRRFIDLDDYITAKAGMSIPELFSTKGEAAFREMEAECLREVLFHEDNIVLALGGGTVLNPLSAALVQTFTQCWYLKASAGKLEEWLSESAGSRPLLQKNSVAELLEKRKGIYESTGGHSLEVDDLQYSEIADIICSS